MKVGSIPDPFAGEKLADVVPRLAPFVDDEERLARLRYFPGRHLTDLALQGEQAVRVQRLRLRGQSVTEGVVEGLEVTWLAAAGDVEFHISAGHAVAASGEDLVLDRRAVVRLADMWEAQATGVVADANIGQPPPPRGPFAAILVLQPGFIRDDDLPPAAQAEPGATDFTPGPRSPADEVYRRTTTIDACRLLLVHPPWEEPFDGVWRSRVAWSFFDREMRGDARPWLDLGVPLAVVGFADDFVPLWIDRHAVVRPGGRSRRRCLVAEGAGPRLWNAQFDQFCAQLADVASPVPAAGEFRFLPPVGALPKVYLALERLITDPQTGAGSWQLNQTFFPAGYVVDVAVTPLEQLDALVSATRSLQPYDLSHLDVVRLLLPVSQTWFNPRLLAIETPDPAFEESIARFRDRRGDWLASRIDLRGRLTALSLAATGEAPSFADPDAKQLETPEEPVGAPPGDAEQFGTVRTGVNGESTYSAVALSELRAKAGDLLRPFSQPDFDEFGELFKGCGLAPADREELLKLIGSQPWLSDPAVVSPEGADPVLSPADKEELRRELLQYIRKQVQLQNEERSRLNTLSLQEIIDDFQARTDEADDLVDAGFLKARTDVFRLGTLLSNNALGAKFAASPSLANIIERKPPKADSAAVNLFASQLLANFAPSTVQVAAPAGAAAPATPASLVLRSTRAGGGLMPGLTVPITPVTTLPGAPVTTVPIGPVTTLPVSPVTTQPVTPVTSLPVGSVSTGSISPVATIPGGTSAFLDLPTLGLGTSVAGIQQVLLDPAQQTNLQAAYDKVLGPQSPLTAEEKTTIAALQDFTKVGGLAEVASVERFASSYVENFNALSQRQLRSIPLDRLQPTLAPTVRGEIHDGRLEIFERLARLNISLGDLTTDFVDVPGTATRPPSPPAGPSLPIARLRFQTLISRRWLDTVSQVVPGTGTVVDADESRYFATGVSYADMAMAALRAVEARIQQYRTLIALCIEARARTEQFIADVTTALAPVETELDEARHDVAVALSLFEEEQARVKRINDARTQVVQQHVGFLVYARPRALRAETAVPARGLEPALAGLPVPDCLQESHELAPELTALREVFRSCPAAWFRYAPQWIGEVNRWDHLRLMLERAGRRGRGNDEDVPLPVSAGRYADPLERVLQNRQTLARNAMAQVTLAAPAALAALSWIDLQQQATRTLTLGQLIDTGPAVLARRAAEELENIFKLGACLHDHFSRVPGITRLQWAERFSQFDGPADFRDLSRLPAWQQVDFTLRREVQILADWLFGRVNADEPEALNLVNDLVRVALLLASHAPVDQLITGSPIDDAVTPVPGGILKLKVDPLRVFRGMTVVHQLSPNRTVRAVVEDISAFHVSARVTAVPPPATPDEAPVTLTRNSVLYFQAGLS
jgi:hypothetical protein